MAKFSKNSRRNDKTQRFYCPCGGEVRMSGIMKKAKLRWLATCSKCGIEKKKPSDF